MQGGGEGGDWGLGGGLGWVRCGFEVESGVEVGGFGIVVRLRTASGWFFRISRPFSLSSDTVNS